MNRSRQHRIVGLLTLSVLLVSVSPVMAQPGRRTPAPPHYHHHHHRGPSDFDKTMRIIGAVGAVAAAANGYTPYHYHRHPRPVVVVPAPAPSTIIVEKQAPVVVEKIVEKPVIVEKEVIVEKTVTVPETTYYYSPKLGAHFEIQNMQIPGYKFRAARLRSDPLTGSPLSELGLVKGDVITRLNNDPVGSLQILEKYEKNTSVRYIKTGTTKVQLGRIFIPPDDEFGAIEETDANYLAP